MSISFAASEAEDEVVSSINTTPLVDVMLVLLIIFLITIPVVTQTVQVALPLERSQPRVTKPENINLAVTRDGAVFWNERRIEAKAELVERLKSIAVADPQPEVQIRGDADGAYEGVGKVVLACQRVGIQKISFITEPPPRN